MATTRIVTARERYDLLLPWLQKESSVPPVTLFSKPNCPQCEQTHKLMTREGIPHEVRDVTADPEAHAFVTGLGYMAAPVVHAGDDNHWSGFRPDRVRSLKG